MSTVQAQPGVSAATKLAGPLEVTIYPHSMLLYWWPVWVTGYILALLTWLEGTRVRFGDVEVIMHPSKNLGVIYTTVFLLVVVLTNSTVRGMASALVIAVILALTFLFAYLDLWEDILRAISYLAMYMNLGFYVFFSTAILIIWALAVFVFDRVEYWTFRPGQVVHHMVFGGGARTFDTMNMSVYKLRSDLFRHWILGLGSGDIHLSTAGANSREFVLPNVMQPDHVADRHD
jgi:lysylphosphatidylglycerol synthetase-like protein (DUF2156 family)